MSKIIIIKQRNPIENKLKTKRILNRKNKRLFYVIFFILFLTFSATKYVHKTNAITYPGTGDWTISSNDDFTITTDFTLTGNIYNNGNLTIRNCKIYAVDRLYTLYSYPGARLILSNVSIIGKDSNNGTNYGALTIDNQGDYALIENSAFYNFGSIAIRSSKNITITGCEFNTISGNSIRITPETNANTTGTRIEDNLFKNSPLYFSIFVDGSQSLANNWTIRNNTVLNSGGFRLNGVNNFTLDENKFSNAKINGISIPYQATNITIKNNEFNSTKSAIYLGSTINVLVQYNKITLGNDFGIEVDSTLNVSITDNEIEMISGSGILDYTDFAPPNYVAISNNTFTTAAISKLSSSNNKITFLDLARAEYISNKRNIIIDNSTTIDGIPIRVYRNFENQTFSLNGDSISKLIIWNVNNSIFSDFSIQNGDGVLITEVFNCTFNNFDLKNNYGNGITLDVLENSTLINGTIRANRANGIKFWPPNWYNAYANNLVLKNLIILKNNEDGLSLSHINNSMIENVSSLGNLYGLALENANNLIIQSSNFSENTNLGINIYTMTNSVINSSVFSKNLDTNLILSGELTNTIVENCEFVKNSSLPFIYNAYVDSQNSVIFDSNHWSDYTGWDDGPGNGDGYGDTPYIVNSSSSWGTFKDLHPRIIDIDHDKLDIFIELKYGTDPTNNDTDNDSLSDYQELFPLRAFNDTIDEYLFNITATNPLDADSDDDGLTDGNEMLNLYTNPNSKDTDQDGFWDSDEISSGSDPLDPNDWPGKTNQDNTITEVDSSAPTPIPERSIKAIPGYPIIWQTFAFIGTIFTILKSMKEKIENTEKNKIAKKRITEKTENVVISPMNKVGRVGKW